MDSVVAVHHVKTYRAESQIDLTNPDDMLDFRGNALVDDLARNHAINLHPNISDPVSVRDSFHSDLYRVAIHIGKALALYPHYRQLVKDVPRLVGSGRAALAKQLYPCRRHLMSWNGSVYVCIACCMSSSSASGPKMKCLGTNLLFDKLISHDRGHHLAVVMAGPDPVVYCRRCGCFSELKGKGLLRQCSGLPTQHGRQALVRIAKLKHPNGKGNHVTRPAFLHRSEAITRHMPVGLGAFSPS